MLRPIIAAMQRNINSLNNSNAATQELIATTNLDIIMAAEEDRKNQVAINNSLNSVLFMLASGATGPPIVPGRTITFANNTANTPLDLYLTVGGSYAEPIKKLTTLQMSGPEYVWEIPEVYNWSGNFNVLPAGSAIPKYNAGPTLFEIDLNGVWAGNGNSSDLRDTFDISTVPPGIGTSVNNGPRSAAVAASVAAGFDLQTAYSYNVGISVIPPVGAEISVIEPPVIVTCNVTNGDSNEAITYPLATNYPRQQTIYATGNYQVNFIDPVVSL